MNYRVCSAVVLLALAVLIAPGTARGDIITPMFFDGFEGDTPDVLNSTLLKWNVVSGSIDVLSAGNLCGPSGNYSNCVDLDGSGAMAGTIETKQTFALDEGIYRLSFDLAGANRKWAGSLSNTVSVSFGSYFTEDITMLQYDPFQTFTRDIIVDSVGTAKINFSHHGSDMIGLLLDNVALVHVVPDEPQVIPTPEGGSWELLVSMVGLAGWGFRKKAAWLGARG